MKEEMGNSAGLVWAGNIKKFVRIGRRLSLVIAPALTPVDSQLELRGINRSEVRGMLEDNFDDFAPAVNRLKAQLRGGDDPTRHPRKIGGGIYTYDDGYEGTVAYRITSADPFDSKEYVVRLIYASNDNYYAQNIRREERRYTALERGLFIDPRYRNRVEHIVAADQDSYITVTELLRARPVPYLKRDEIEAISVDTMREARDTVIALAECGVKTEPHWANTLITHDLLDINFVDYLPMSGEDMIDPTMMTEQSLKRFNTDFRWWTLYEFDREKQFYQVLQERMPEGK